MCILKIHLCHTYGPVRVEQTPTQDEHFINGVYNFCQMFAGIQKNGKTLLESPRHNVKQY